MCGLFETVRVLVVNEVDVKETEAFYPKMIENLCDYERVFPPTNLTMIVKLLIKSTFCL